MRFSEYFEISAADVEWFDPVLTEDTPLYVDPFLLYDDDDPFWQPCHDHVVRFFSVAMQLVRRAGGNRESVHWGKALRLLTFPEPKEFALGLSMGTPVGSGTGAEYARIMAEALEIVGRSEVTEVEFVELFTLFSEGLGPDRISDIFCNILKWRFIEYTQAVARDHGAAVTRCSVRHLSWSAAHGRWQDGTVDLPLSPVTEGAILLVPQRFLKDIPSVTARGFWNWAEVNESEMLRDDLNYDLAENLTRSEKNELARELARQRPELATRYVRHVADDLPHTAYDATTDPDLLIGWHEAGRLAFEPALAPDGNPEESGFCEWVGGLLDRFRHAVEDMDLWRAFWNDEHTIHRKEAIVQAVAGSLLAMHCEAADVDITRESNMGRGPVDFKFSRGWTSRALVEVKLIASSHFNKGAEKQLPQYLQSERIACGYYLCVGFFARDFEAERLQKVTETCRVLSEQKGVQITPLVVDARPKVPASKL